MHALRTAVLEHTTADGVHHDWLIEDPALPDPRSPDARLWTARVPLPPRAWASVGRFDLRVLPPHRRDYLSYQGAVSRGRGRVRRVASGFCHPLLWTVDRIVLEVRTDAAACRIRIERLQGSYWLAMLG